MILQMALLESKMGATLLCQVSNRQRFADYVLFVGMKAVVVIE